jgi:aryl-alcohol dehydrogenase-like predicted oxidoreductase
VTSRYAGEPDPGPAVDLENRSLTKYKLIVEEVGGWGRYQDLLDVVADVADKHDVSIANVATRYVFEKPGVCAAIVGSRDTKHIDSNRRTLDLRLDEADHRRLDDARSRLDDVPGGVYSVERDGDSRHTKVMKYDLNEEQRD